MANQIGWSEAEAAVGKDDPGSDWELKPEQHAAELPAQAGALRRVLERDEIKEIMARYREYDGAAGRQQKRFRSASKRIVRGAYIAAVSGLFALSMHLIMGYQTDLQLLAIFFHVAALVYVILATVMLNRSDPRKKWQESRGQAELLRVALFDRVAEATDPGPEAPNEIALLPLQLAYFRRYQLDVQWRYCKGRGKQLARPSGLNAWYTSLCAVVAIAAFVLACLMLLHLVHEHGVAIPDALLPLINPQLVEQLAYWVFLGLGLSTIYAVLMTHQSISEDQRNGSRYLALFENFDFLRENGYEPVRKAAEAGDRAKVLKYINLVHELMISEQNEWVSLQQMVERKDRVLATSAATGLADLFADRFDPPGNAQTPSASVVTPVQTTAA
ncbi:MAG: hypothetical protein ACR2OV_16985 [Hyphomicrobiaceae bacterium]